MSGIYYIRALHKDNIREYEKENSGDFSSMEEAMDFVKKKVADEHTTISRFEVGKSIPIISFYTNDPTKYYYIMTIGEKRN